MNKKYWLWIGLLGIIVAGGAYYYLDNIGDSALVNIPFLPAIIVSIGLFGLNHGTDGVIPFMVFIVYGFVMGVIFGWIYGKIKTRKLAGTTTN